MPTLLALDKASDLLYGADGREIGMRRVVSEASSSTTTLATCDEEENSTGTGGSQTGARKSVPVEPIPADTGDSAQTAAPISAALAEVSATRPQWVQQTAKRSADTDLEPARASRPRPMAHAPPSAALDMNVDVYGRQAMAGGEVAPSSTAPELGGPAPGSVAERLAVACQSALIGRTLSRYGGIVQVCRSLPCEEPALSHPAVSALHCAACALIAKCMHLCFSPHLWMLALAVACNACVHVL